MGESTPNEIQAAPYRKPPRTQSGVKDLSPSFGPDADLDDSARSKSVLVGAMMQRSVTLQVPAAPVISSPRHGVSGRR